MTIPDSSPGGRLIYRDTDWPHGLSCPACRHVMQDGDPYLERLDAVMVDCELVTSGFCPDCLEEPNP